MKVGDLISFRKKYTLLLYMQKFKAFSYFNDSNIDKTKAQAYVFLAADYGNLGDVAITYAQKRFIGDNSNCQINEIPISKSLEGIWFVKRNIKKGDIVTIVGGGNMGDLYDQIEYIRQLVVKFFPHNKIISFPQTFDFSESPRGKKTLRTAQKVYNKHSKLYMIAREQTSFELMKKHFSKATILLTPDIVLTLNKSEPQEQRKGVVICMRSDAEKSLTNAQSDFIIESAKMQFTSLTYYDTHIGKNNLSVQERVTELNKIWQVFKKAELVITDRLHGMIFCHITNTPCLVFLNNNHKVKGTYNWIKKNSNITLMESFSEEAITAFLSQESFIKNEYTSLIKEYRFLINSLK